MTWTLLGRALGALVVSAGSPACAQMIGLDDLVADLEGAGAGATAGPGAGAGGGCASTCGTPGCGACPPTPVVQVGSFGVDAYETTFAEYDAWLATAPSLTGQRPECTWNDSFQSGVPSFAALQEAADAGVMNVDVTGGVCDDPAWMSTLIANGQSDRPVTCVDWCDAVAYCAWAGKHLCGRIGGGSSLDVTPDDGGPYDDPEQSQWYRACSNAGAQPYPYGDTYQPSVCNDENSSPKAVGSFTGCEGGYPGLFDMSGNVSEWEDACTEYSGPPLVQNCLIRGGAFYETGDAEALSCLELRPVLRVGPSDTLGFRCCSGP